MNKNIYKYSIITLLFFVFSLSSYGQSKKLLKAQKDLAETRSLLNSLSRKSSRTYMRYQVLVKQINLQEILLENIKTEIDSLDKKIVFNTKKRTEIKKNIKMLKGEYEELIFYAYKTRNTRNKTIFIFSSKTFNQAYRRFVYLQYLTEYLEETTNDLKVKTDSLEYLNERLNLQKSEKLVLKENQTDELLNLNESKTFLARILTKLNNQKDKLKEDLRKKEKIAAALRKSIKKSVSSGSSIKKSPLSLKFERKKGKLPFPVKGIIASSFGKHTHSVLKNVKINNDGIEIATSVGAKAKSVHPGIVSQVLKIPGANNAVIVKHGQYYTVYSNLADVYVSKGDNLVKGQEIGIPDSRMLNFQIWYLNKKLNPQKWLR